MGAKSPCILDLAGNSHSGYVDWEDIATSVDKTDNLHTEHASRYAKTLHDISIKVGLATESKKWFKQDGDWVKIKDWMDKNGYRNGVSDVNNIIAYLDRHPECNSLYSACTSLWTIRRI